MRLEKSLTKAKAKRHAQRYTKKREWSIKNEEWKNIGKQESGKNKAKKKMKKEMKKDGKSPQLLVYIEHHYRKDGSEGEETSIRRDPAGAFSSPR